MDYDVKNLEGEMIGLLGIVGPSSELYPDVSFVFIDSMGGEHRFDENGNLLEELIEG